MTITDKLNKLKAIRDKATRDGEACFTAPCGDIKDKLIESVTSNVIKSIEHDPTIPFYFVRTKDELIVANFGCGPTSQNNMDFFTTAANNWNTLIECLEVANKSLSYYSRDHAGGHKAVATLSEIESKLGGI